MTKVLVIGTGAIGGFYSGKLSQAGAEVSVICRSDYEVVNEKGFEIKSSFGDFDFSPNQVLKSVEEYQDEADYILVSTKVLPNIPLVEIIKPAVSKNTSIVLLQNGIHIEHEVAKAFPNNHLISGLAFVFVAKIAPGKIHHQNYGKVILGDFPKGITSKTEKLVKLWQDSGVPCDISQNIGYERWKKLVWNAAFNPTSVLSGGIDTQKILQNSAAKKLVINVMKEVCLLAKADGYNLEEDVIDKNIEATLNMKPYKTSMLLDFEANRDMEIEAILGNAIRFANKEKIAVPYMESLYGLISCF